MLGQNIYVNYDGRLGFTLPHSMWYPDGSIRDGEGWIWTPYERASQELKAAHSNCQQGNVLYDCRTPSGFWNFKAHDTPEEGFAACRDVINRNRAEVLHGMRPKLLENFEEWGCVKLPALASMPYRGPVPRIEAFRRNDD